MDTGIQAKTTTDDNGNYDFFNVRVGRYSIAVEHAGFSRFTTSDVAVNVNARQRVDATTTVGAITQTVEVTGAATALQTDSSEHGQVFNAFSAVVESSAQRPQLCGPGAAIHQRRQVSHRRSPPLLLAHRGKAPST